MQFTDLVDKKDKFPTLVDPPDLRQCLLAFVLRYGVLHKPHKRLY
jgi:hypothetical protein